MIWAMWLATAMAGDAIRYEVMPTAIVGEGAPELRFEPALSGSLVVEATCGATVVRRELAMSKGKQLVVPLDTLPPGTHDCAVHFELTGMDGSQGSSDFTFTAAVLPSLELSAQATDLDLDAGTLQIAGSRSLAAASVEVLGVGGAVLATAEGEGADGGARFAWSTAEEVVQLRVIGEDTHGFRAQLVLTPWSYEIPHEDVIFASGSAEIPPGELSKLNAVVDDLSQVLTRYGAVSEVRLYIVGFTDTVGEASTNQALSERRAKAIAQWFRTAGFTGPVAYQGLGERGLLVATGDGVDEARNRRALYVVAAAPPAPTKGLPLGRWRPL